MLTIRCSQLARPMVCAGSLFFTDLPVQETGAAAQEGTAAGEYLERLLTGRPVSVGESASNGYAFDSDMAFYTLPIAEEILTNTQSPVLCEQRIDWQTHSGIWIRGQYDASFVRNGDLYIDDLKYGWGLVEVRENWQLIGYAIGEILRRGTTFPNIVFRIHQPRPHHPDGATRTWKITYEELLDYKRQIENRMTDIVNGDRSLVTSPKCRYCPAAATACTALNKSFYRGVESVEDFHQDEMNDQELAHQLELFDRIDEVFKTKMSALRDLAITRINAGKVLPGWTTEASYGDRKWKKDVSPEVIAMLSGGKKVTEEIMLSPAKAEKLGLPKELVNQMVDRHFLGNKVRRADKSLGSKIFGTGDK